MKPTENSLGSLEHIVLLAVMRLGAAAYGMTVRQEIESTAGRNISIGAVYTTLLRLEAKGLLRSHSGEPTPQRGGRAKRYLRVTASGEAAVRNTHEVFLKMSAGLKGLQVR